MIDTFPLHWPPQWPRTQYPEYSRFETTIARARDGVIRELELLGAPTLNSYSHVTSDMQRRAADTLDAAFREVS
jgi:hypothetical protein